MDLEDVPCIAIMSTAAATGCPGACGLSMRQRVNNAGNCKRGNNGELNSKAQEKLRNMTGKHKTKNDGKTQERNEA